ncbi:MAG: 4-alpha-glucanotransferase [bacterium]|nr:4-alpha-glucanotransferase [bacterium]
MPTKEFKFERSSGVLLHPTCLPGADGIGDLGQGAFRFVDWLNQHGQSLWQVLPLGPTSFGDSPYQTLSAFAGNPLLISLEKLVDDGWLSVDFLADRPDFDDDRVEFGPVIEWKFAALKKAWLVFQETAAASDRARLEDYRQQNSEWLEDFALFMALKNDFDGKPWNQWDSSLVIRESLALDEARLRLSNPIASFVFVQWLFHEQWQQLRSYAAAKAVRLVGDLPIFVAYDSSDVWANPQYFQLADDGRPTHVAGVPPDYFSKTGQLWGNPLYDWSALEQDSYRWWIARLRGCLEQCDVVRIDHFRGFAGYWEIPADEKTAVNGVWKQGPGASFFEALQEAFGKNLPVIAEDLGVITSDVVKLRDQFNLPGMKVLQFAFSGPENVFLPHEYQPNCVVYSGTHDNDPTMGWWNHLTDATCRDLVARYNGHPVEEPNWTLLRMGMLSCAHTFIATMQDVLGLGREARMNLPGEGKGNWNWRMPADAFIHPAGERLAQLTWLARRKPDQKLSAPSEPEFTLTTPKETS